VRESVTISLPEDLKTELDRLTATDGVSRSDVMREALREYLFARQLQELRRKMIPYAEAQGVFTDEDVFREIS
jgi:metal-responsive CopG/Arc/MetJ family transcriptional regulator